MPGYKQTEVGVIPDEWGVKTIDQIAFVTSGKRLPLGSSLVDVPTPHPYVRVTDMRPGTVDISEIMYVPESVFPAIKRYRIYQADIFISVAGSLGIVGKIPAELDGANLTENADRITDIMCSQDYLLYVLLSPLIQNAIDSIRTVGAQPKLALTRIRKFAIPVPPTEIEQCAIATALSDVDALLGRLDRLIAKKRDLKQAAMQQLLTGRTRLPGFHGEWEVKRLGELLAYEQPTKYLVKSSEYSDANDVPVLTAGKTFILGYTNEDAGVFENLPVIIFDDFTTATKYVTFPFKAKSSAMKLLKPRNPSVNLKLVYEMMRLVEFKLSEHKRYWISEYQDLELGVPCEKEQNAIMTVLSGMDAELAALVARRDKTRDLKQAMMQELLTGKTRLVPIGAAHA